MRGGRDSGRPALFLGLLLPRHGDTNHFRRIYKVIGILGCIGDRNFNSYDLSVESIPMRAVVR